MSRRILGCVLVFLAIFIFGATSAHPSSSTKDWAGAIMFTSGPSAIITYVLSDGTCGTSMPVPPINCDASVLTDLAAQDFFYYPDGTLAVLYGSPGHTFIQFIHDEEITLKEVPCTSSSYPYGPSSYYTSSNFKSFMTAVSFDVDTQTGYVTILYSYWGDALVEVWDITRKVLKSKKFIAGTKYGYTAESIRGDCILFSSEMGSYSTGQISKLKDSVRPIRTKISLSVPSSSDSSEEIILLAETVIYPKQALSFGSTSLATFFLLTEGVGRSAYLSRNGSTYYSSNICKQFDQPAGFIAKAFRKSIMPCP